MEDNTPGRIKVTIGSTEKVQDTSIESLDDNKPDITPDPNTTPDKTKSPDSSDGGTTPKTEVEDKGGANDTEIEQVEIDNVVYTINANGDAVAEDGTVFKTAEELKALEDETEEGTVTELETIQKHLGVIPVDEKGTPVQYERTPEGVARYAADAAKVLAEDLFKREQEIFFQNNPDIRAAYLHKLKYGTIEGFNAPPSWKDFDVTKASANDLISVITSYRKSLGDDDTSIQYFVEKLSADKKLTEYAGVAHKQLLKIEDSREAEIKKIEDDKRKTQEDIDKKYWNDVETIIKTGSIKTDEEAIAIPEVLRRKENGVIKTYSKADFLAYVSKQKEFDVNGQKYALTQYQYDLAQKMNNRNVNHELLEALRMFVGNDTSQIIQQSLKEERATRIKRFTTKSGTTGSSTGAGTGKIIIKRN